MSFGCHHEPNALLYMLNILVFYMKCTTEYEMHIYNPVRHVMPILILVSVFKMVACP